MFKKTTDLGDDATPYHISIEAEVVSPVKRWCGLSDTDRDITFASPRGRVAAHTPDTAHLPFRVYPHTPLTFLSQAT